MPLTEKQRAEALKIVKKIALDRNGTPFAHPVSEDEAPGYTDYIRTPMDFETIINRLENDAYPSTGLFIFKSFNVATSYKYSEDSISGKQCLQNSVSVSHGISFIRCRLYVIAICISMKAVSCDCDLRFPQDCLVYTESLFVYCYIHQVLTVIR